MSWKFQLAALAAVCLGATSGCGLLTMDCGKPESRSSSLHADVVEAGTSVAATASVAFFEERGSASVHQLAVEVEGLRGATIAPAPAELRGHITTVRLEQASGTSNYSVALTPSDNPLLAGYSVTKTLPDTAFARIRTQLLAEPIYVVIVTDNGIQLPRTRLTLDHNSGWVKGTCD